MALRKKMFCRFSIKKSGTASCQVFKLTTNSITLLIYIQMNDIFVQNIIPMFGPKTTRNVNLI